MVEPASRRLAAVAAVAALAAAGCGGSVLQETHSVSVSTPASQTGASSSTAAPGSSSTGPPRVAAAPTLLGAVRAAAVAAPGALSPSRCGGGQAGASGRQLVCTGSGASFNHLKLRTFADRGALDAAYARDFAAAVRLPGSQLRALGSGQCTAAGPTGRENAWRAGSRGGQLGSAGPAAGDAAMDAAGAAGRLFCWSDPSQGQSGIEWTNVAGGGFLLGKVSLDSLDHAPLQRWWDRVHGALAVSG